MEDFALDLTIGKEFNSKVTRINVPHFTLIGATTKLGKLPLPFEERFSIVINIREYTHEEICKILIRASAKLQLKISDDEITTIAKNSKNIPRNGIRLIKRVFDFKNCQTKLDINQIMQKLGYFENGLDQNDFNYLLILNKHLAPVGIKTVAHLLNIDQETIEIKIEPYLINHNYIQKTNKGRIITKKGKDFLINNS
jgi:Holliday junction DNA helicase RuvB